MTLYLVCPAVQETEINNHCFGDCGRIKIGAIEYEGAYFLPCRVLECPYSFAEAEFATADMGDGEEKIIGRRLKNDSN